ncbi:sensor histidine kinase [Microbacterium karelineae]|uniref:sensor histidine kinase n=1 Tax=Microbacterium karelineae TaxID=2654283 RepID=UPI0012E9A8C1|nr:ATP-binding protein [Microbacterium karelineae]
MGRALPHPPEGEGVPTGGARLTLQSRLMLTVFSIVAGILLVVSIVTGVMLNNVLNSQVDNRVQDASRSLRSDFGITMLDGTASEQLDRSHAPPGTLLVISSPFTGTTGAIVTGDFERRTLSEAQIERVVEATANAPGELTTVSLPGAGTFRVAALKTVDSQETVGAFGMTTASENATLRTMLWAIGFATIGGMMLLGIATSGVIRSGLRPLRDIAQTATRVSRQRLDQGDVSIPERVPPEQSDPCTEVGQVGSSLNTLLDHVEESLSARQRNEETMRRFVADASHELRTPLASIRGYSELSLRDRALTDSSRQSLQRIEAQSQRMTGLVEDLLLLARLDEGTDIVYDMVDLTQLVLDAVADQAMAGMEHDWGADVGEEHVFVAGDRARLTQVITNLLANARTHTPEGTEVTVSLRTEGDGSATRAIVDVHDTGPGIAPALQKTLFTRFARGDTSRARKTGGSGLGLSIAKALVEAHHGTISVASEPGSTTFTVVLPAKPASAG